MIIADLLDANDTHFADHPSAGYDWVARIRVDDEGGVEIVGDEATARRVLAIGGITSGLSADGEVEAKELSFAHDPERWLRDSDAIFRTGYTFFAIYADSGADAAAAERRAVEDAIVAETPSWGPHVAAQRETAAADARADEARARMAARTTAMLAAADAPTVEERMLLPWGEPVHEGASLSTRSRAHWQAPGKTARGTLAS